MYNIHTLSHEEKMSFHHENQTLIKGIFNIHALYHEMKKNDIGTYNDLLVKGKKLDLNLFINKIIFKEMNCFLFDGYHGFIYKNNKNNYQYITRNNENTYYLDIIDFLELYFGKDIENILNNLLKGEFLWKEKEFSKLQNNLIKTEKDSRLQILSSMPIYKFLNKKAFDYDISSIVSHNENAIYFISTRFISKNTNMSQTKVLNDLKTLHELGFIQILKDSEFSKLVKKTKLRKEKEKLFYKDTNGFIIHDIETVLENLDENILKMNKRKKTISKEKHLELKENNVREFLMNRMNEYGFLSVELLEKEDYPFIKDAVLVMNVLFQKIKPTKSMKNKFMLKSNQYIYVKKRIF